MYDTIFYFQAVDNADKYELFDELDIWISSHWDATNINSIISLQGATSVLAATSAALVAASLF